MSNTSVKALYPIIISCMNNSRQPNSAEIRKVTLRVYREIHAEGASRYDELRRALLIARAALGIGVR